MQNDSYQYQDSPPQARPANRDFLRTTLELVIHYILYVVMLGALVLAVSSARAADAEEPQQVVQAATTRLLATLEQNRDTLAKNPDALRSLINDTVIGHFDFQRMSQLVLGKYWRSASDAQRQVFPAQFQELLVRTYTTALLSYDKQEIHYTGVTRADDEVIVKTEIAPSAGSPIPVHYRMHRVQGQWKVYDVVIDSISLVTNYRSSFASEIRASGLDGLITKLQAKNQQVAKAG